MPNHKLKSLSYLSLAVNRLASLPASIGELKNLQILNLHINQLRSLPASIGKLENLQRLNLYRNQLSTLPESICDLTNLKALFLKGNKLPLFPKKVFLKLKNLQELDIPYRNNNGNNTRCQMCRDDVKISRYTLGDILFDCGFPSSLDDGIWVQKVFLCPECVRRLKNIGSMVNHGYERENYIETSRI